MVQTDVLSTVEAEDIEEQRVTPAELSMHPESGLKTSDFYKTENIPERFNHPDWFEGYNTKQCHPFYQTSAGDYG